MSNNPPSFSVTRDDAVRASAACRGAGYRGAVVVSLGLPAAVASGCLPHLQSQRQPARDPQADGGRSQDDPALPGAVGWCGGKFPRGSDHRPGERERPNSSTPTAGFWGVGCDGHRQPGPLGLRTASAWIEEQVRLKRNAQRFTRTWSIDLAFRPATRASSGLCTRCGTPIPSSLIALSSPPARKLRSTMAREACDSSTAGGCGRAG